MKNYSECVEVISVKKLFSDKYFRAKKLLNDWNKIKLKLEEMLERGLYNKTHTAKCAWAVLVMMETGIRVGNEKSAEGYLCVNAYDKNFKKNIKTYGLTTLLKKHCFVRNYSNSGRLYMNFVGKKSVSQSFIVESADLVRSYNWLFVNKLAKETLLDVTHYELTKFVKRYIGKKYSIKDIRTAKVNQVFIDTMTIYEALIESVKLTKKSEANKIAMEVVEVTAAKIGHTKQVCKSRYVSPNLFQYYKEYLYELLAKKKGYTFNNG